MVQIQWIWLALGKVWGVLGLACQGLVWEGHHPGRDVFHDGRQVPWFLLRPRF